ncbi:hypothetical protein [Modestobacter roseus]|uniref:DoxX-like protein n=1 Tax=Modestobacter roseus TaxID=1181884 RepID=A0A562IS97_9ACTN|nr:hypothetical protein [Modestobacter roseus]MQA32636.1 hypothetical protein [Modestobacter roseus]TWH73720.1 hypothetical protein JD78_02244 [Modestobacter roseus]
MRLPITPAEIAPRIATGAFILNSGLGKRSVDGGTAAGLHGFAAGAYPFLKKVQPATFAKALSTTEIAIGAALLTPFVPTAVAGAALTGFSGGLVGLYLRTPGMTKPGSVAPTQDGLTIAKDVWMLGIGLGLLTEALTGRSDRAAARRRARRAPGKRAMGKAAHQGSRKAARKGAKLAAAENRALARAAATAGAVSARARDAVAA